MCGKRRLVHPDALRSIDDDDAKAGAARRVEFGAQGALGPGQDDLEASTSGSLDGARDHRGRRVVAAHRVDGDDGIRHAGLSQSSATALAWRPR